MNYISTFKAKIFNVKDKNNKSSKEPKDYI